MYAFYDYFDNIIINYINSFALAHLHGKCRRAVILEYFGEEPVICENTSLCCDVCASPHVTVIVYLKLKQSFKLLMNYPVPEKRR